MVDTQQTTPQIWKNLKNLTLKYNLMSRKNCISHHAMSPFEAGTQLEILKFHMCDISIVLVP